MPFDFSSFFTPRFPVRNRAEEPLGPDLPPNFYSPDEINKYAMEEQEKLPVWKRKLASMGESAFDYTAGLLGLPGVPQTRSSEYGELTNAGIPFLSLGKKVGLREINNKPVVFRGDPGVTYKGERYTHVNPQYYNRADTLGWMTHAAEESSYPESYMFKQGDPTNPHSWNDNARKARPTISPLTSTAKNAVDLVHLPEDPEDVEKLIKGLELWNPARSPFATERVTLAKAKELREEIPHMYRRQMEIDRKLREGANLSVRESRDQDEIALMMKDVRATLNDPDIANMTRFDAIRYDDEGRMSWAFPDVKKLESPWGSKFTLNSMQDYPYRVVGRKEAASSGESLGHFATKRDAAKAAVSAGTGSKIYLGDNQIARVPYKMNYGLEDYLKADKAIQHDVNLVNEGGNILNKLQKQHDKSISSKPPSSVQNKFAQKVYGDDYDNLSTWAKEDVDMLASGKHQLDTDDEFEGLDWSESDKVAHKKDKLMMQLENEIASDKYKKDFDQLTDAQKKEVFEDAEEMYNEGGYALEIPQGPNNPTTLDASPAEIKKFKNEGVSYNSVADHFFDEKYADLDDSQQKEVKKFTDWIEKGAPNYKPMTLAEYDKKTDKYGIGKQYEMKDSMGHSASDELQKDFDAGIYSQDDAVKDFVKEKIKQVKKFEMGEPDALSGKKLFEKYPGLPYDYKIVDGKLVKMSTNEQQAYMAMKKAEHASWVEEPAPNKIYNVSNEDIQKFADKKYTTDQIAEHFYGKSFDKLDKVEKNFILDVTNDVAYVGTTGKKPKLAMGESLDDVEYPTSKKYESPVSLNTLDELSDELINKTHKTNPAEFFDWVIDKTGKSYYDLTGSEFENLFGFNPHKAKK